ncbi:hypothetical protein Emed_001570 [Eimeria media]
MGGALSFGFFLGCGMVIRCQEPKGPRGAPAGGPWGPLVGGPPAWCARGPDKGLGAPKWS